MNYTRITLKSALLLGASQMTIVSAHAADCAAFCAPPPVEAVLCGKDAADRPCGPLIDNSDVELRGVPVNTESMVSAGAVDQPAFRVSIDGVPVDTAVLPNTADLMREADLAASAIKLTPAQEKPSHTQVQADTLQVQPALSIAANRAVVRPGVPLSFFTFANYARFIDMAEVLIFRAEDTTDAAPYIRVSAKLGEPALWTPSDKDEGSYRYALRVYAKTGRYDQTESHPLLVSRTQVVEGSDERTGPVFENQRVISEISVKGAMVTVSGSDLPEGAKVELFGTSIPVTDEGRFVTQQIVPEGVDAVRYSVTAADGSREEIERPVVIPTKDSFLVAIADVTAGHRSWDNKQAVEALQGERADMRENFVDGRLAFYYKAKLNSRYRLTAAADTGEHPLSDLFGQFGKKDPRSLLRRLDPDQHYPVYGDDSTTIEDAPTYGRFYVRAESENAEAMWGNFQTTLTGTDLVQYSRGLYGGKLAWHSLGNTSFGEKRTELTGFAADPGTVGSREELSSTGGSLYYLHRRDITQGSERIAVEVRDRDSGLVLERRELAPGTDYEVNYLQGRLTLRNPVPITAKTSQLVRDNSLTGNPVTLVVNYEYSPGLSAPQTLTLGGRGSQWLTDYLRVGVTGYHQGQDQEEQDLYGTDLLLRYKPGTFVRAEFARSKGTGSATSLSSSGGYAFTDVQAAGGTANGYIVETGGDLAELGIGRGRVGGYWRNRGAGFSGPGVLTGNQAQQQFGGTLDVALSSSTALVGKADLAKSDNADTRSLEAGITQSFGQNWFGKLGVRMDNRADSSSFAQPVQSVASRTDGAVTIGYRSDGYIDQSKSATAQPVAAQGNGKPEDHPWQLYLFGQKTLDGAVTRRDNDRVGLGGDVQINQHARLNAEVSHGSSGTGAKVGAEYAMNDRGSLELNYALAAENPDGYNTGRLGRVSATSRYRFTDAVSVFAEGRFDHGQGPTGLTQGYGVDFAPTKHLQLGLRYDRGNLRDAQASGTIKRQAFGLTADLTLDKTHFSSALEYRTENDLTQGKRRTWATRNSVTYKANDDWRVYGKANLAFTDGLNSDAMRANYYEFVAAAAYRPVTNDRLNVLTKFTYLYDRPEQGQLGGYSYNTGFAQRSKVAAIDATYQLTPSVSVGAKYALRVGELRSTTQTGAQWFNSQAQFFAVRADLRVVKEWDALVELRRLSVREARDNRLGILAGVYRSLGNHVKLGVGYNFSNYSDELTNLSNKERGFFFNIVGKY